jgi:hypothetical protein
LPCLRRIGTAMPVPPLSLPVSACLLRVLYALLGGHRRGLAPWFRRQVLKSSSRGNLRHSACFHGLGGCECCHSCKTPLPRPPRSPARGVGHMGSGPNGRPPAPGISELYCVSRQARPHKRLLSHAGPPGVSPPQVTQSAAQVGYCWATVGPRCSFPPFPHPVASLADPDPGHCCPARAAVAPQTIALPVRAAVISSRPYRVHLLLLPPFASHSYCIKPHSDKRRLGEYLLYCAYSSSSCSYSHSSASRLRPRK